MKTAIVIHPMVQCMINRNLCQRITNYLEINGITIVSSIREADYIFFSGCGVLEANEAEGIYIIQYIRQMIKKENGHSTFFLIGCLPKINRITKGIMSNNVEEREGYIIEKFFSTSGNGQFVIIDNYDYTLLDKIINAKVNFENIPYPDKISAKNGFQQLKIGTHISSEMEGRWSVKQRKSYLDLIRLQAQIAKSGFLFPASNDYLLTYGYRQIIIGYGCKNKCAYCAVKFAKNKIESVPLQKIITQIQMLIKKGEKKFVLVADDFGSWGIDLKCGWVDLLENINRIECADIQLAIFNIKVEDILENKESIDILVRNGKLRYLCVMSQHVNSRILKSMKRKSFSKEDFMNLINEYGNKGVQVETFTIVGFPGETDEEFQELVDFICAVETPHFANYSTPFSPRYGTAAYRYDGRLPAEVVMQRIKEIDDKYIVSSQKRFRVLPVDLQNMLYELLCMLKEHEINYEKLAKERLNNRLY